jgi:uncharacterized membrane protein YdjX (TVP38/TMEM64 family)
VVFAKIFSASGWHFVGAAVANVTSFKLKPKTKKLILYVSVFAGVSLAVYFLGARIEVKDIKQIIEKAGVLAPLLYIVILLSTYVVAPFSGTPVFFAGYLAFGKTVQIYSYFTQILAAAVNFWIARGFGRGLVLRLVGDKNMGRVDRFADNYGIGSLIFLRVFQGHFHDFISYAYGLTNIKFTAYFIVSALAPIPWAILWYFYIFDRVENVGDLTMWLLLTIAPLYAVSIFLFRKLSSRR